MTTMRDHTRFGSLLLLATLAMPGTCGLLAAQPASTPATQAPEVPDSAPDRGPGPAPGSATLPASAEHEITPAEAEAAREAAAAAGPSALETAALPPASEPAEALASRADAYAEFLRLFNEHEYAQALVPAQRVVALSELQATTDDLEVALMNLGATQSLAKDLSGAEASYQRVIALIEASGVRASTRLARAHAGLAVAYHDAQRHELSVQQFETAIALARRTAGLFDESQLPLIDKFTDSLTAMAQFERAHDAQRYGLRIVERKYGQNSPQIVPRLEVLARWYTRVGAYDAARLTLRRAITLVEDGIGQNAVELISPLTALAENYRRPLLDPTDRSFESDPNPANAFNTLPGTSDGGTWRMPNALAAEGQRALERALEIAESQPKPSQTRIADVRTQLGDWFQTRLQHDKALPHYQAAWAAAREVKAGAATLAEALFGRPVLLHYVRPTEWDRFERRPPEQVAPHTVEVGMTVTAQGRVRDPAVLTNDGSTRMAEAAIEAAATARYRPRMADGQPLATDGVRFPQTYFEPIPEAAPADKASTAPAAGQSGSS